MIQPCITGGCLCGALRYEASAPPDFAGYCCCADCRRASGSGFIPFMGFPAEALRVTRLQTFEGVAIREVESAEPGDVIILAGIEEFNRVVSCEVGIHEASFTGAQIGVSKVPAITSARVSISIL